MILFWSIEMYVILLKRKNSTYAILHAVSKFKSLIVKTTRWVINWRIFLIIERWVALVIENIIFFFLSTFWRREWSKTFNLYRWSMWYDLMSDRYSWMIVILIFLCLLNVNSCILFIAHFSRFFSVADHDVWLLNIHQIWKESMTIT
jgi:hypothetical protein